MSSVNRLALPPGTQLRDFEVREALGQGGFGITYRAFNTALDQQVAIKEYMPGAFAVRDGNTLSVYPNGAESEDIFQWGLKRFLDEARILARLSHPNIVRVLYYMSLNETGYMVMEYLHGQTLGRWLFERGEPLTQQDILRILDPLTDALALVHDNGLTHRDIKPDNIFMRDGTTPVLIDFGAARNVFTGHSQTVAAIVTPGYSPNEQYSGVSDQGPWTDIYALGGVVYRMICGQAPPDAPSRIAHDMEGRPDPCGSLLNIADTSFDADFLHAIDWALKLRPNERPQNVREWRNALGLGARDASAPTAAANSTETFDWSSPSRQDTGTVAIDTEGDAPSSPLSAPVRRNRFPSIAAALAAILLIAAGGAAAWWYMTREEDSIGNTIAQAFPLGSISVGPVQISDAIGGGDDRDIIRFNLDSEGEVSFRWKGGTPEASLRLFGQDGQQVSMLAADNGGIAELPAGDYALEISSRHGSSQPYVLEMNSSSLEAGARPGASPQNALDLAGRGKMNGSDVLFDGRIWPRQREHFFSFKLDEPSRVSVAMEISNATGSLSFTDPGGIAIATREIEDGKADPLIANLPAGEHYIAVSMRGATPWAYRLKVRTEAGAAALASDGARIAPAGEGESYETARLLPGLARELQSHEIRFTGRKTERYLEIQPDEPGILNIQIAEGHFTEMEVFRGKDGDRIARAAEQDGLTIRANVERGQYIIKLSAKEPSARGRMTLRFTPGSVAGVTDDNPIQFGSLGARAIEDSGTLEAELPEKWFSFSLDKPMRVSFEMTGPDNGPLTEGTTLALHDRERNRVQSFLVREPGEILTQTASLQAGKYLLKLSAPASTKSGYELRLFSLAELAAEARSADDSDPHAHGAATVLLAYDMSRDEGLRLAKARARANAVKGAQLAAETVSASDAEPAGAAELLTALNHGVPYDENWQAQWLSKDRLAVSVKSRIRKLHGDAGFTATLGKLRFITGERIPVGLASSGQPLNIGLFAWQADGTIGRIYPQNAGQVYVMQPGENADVTKDMGFKVASAPLPGKSASEEAIIVVACNEDAAFTDLAPTFAEAAQSSLTRAISTPVYLERLAGFCPASLQVRVLHYRVENPGG